ncbi:MAG: hypothetical protein HG459_007805 [Bacteroidia bacterium]|nr:hypothetical protein [Bacteroidia bacterium]
MTAPTRRVKASGFLRSRRVEALVFLAVLSVFFGSLGWRMGAANLLNSIMATAFDLLTNTVFFIMSITVLSGALAKLFIEFGVLRLVEYVLRPLMRPLYNLPGVAALASVMTFLSDNPAIMSIAHDKNFRSYFTDRELASLPNFGTAFGMGLIVVTYMTSLGYFSAAMLGVAGAALGGVVATRLMQRLCRSEFPTLSDEQRRQREASADEGQIAFRSEGSFFERFLNSILEGGKSGVDLGLAIIPGVLIISTLVILITFGPKDPAVGYQGLAGEGVPVLPWVVGKMGFLFRWLFGFEHAELIAFPVTSLGSVGAALSLFPEFLKSGFIGGNEVAVCTGMGMCWSGFLSTYTAMYDALGMRRCLGRAIVSQVIGGVCAGAIAHFLWLLVSLF